MHQVRTIKDYRKAIETLSHQSYSTETLDVRMSTDMCDPTHHVRLTMADSDLIQGHIEVVAKKIIAKRSYC